MPIQIADALTVLSHSDMQISAPTLAEPVSAQRVDITLSETTFGWNEVERDEFQRLDLAFQAVDAVKMPFGHFGDVWTGQQPHHSVRSVSGGHSVFVWGNFLGFC